MAAGTYTPNDLIEQERLYVGSMPATNTKSQIMSKVLSVAWRKYPWNWTQASLTAISCVDGTQDYAHTQTDFYRLVNLRLVRTDLSPVSSNDSMYQKNHLPKEVRISRNYRVMRNYSWEPTLSKIRLESAINVPSTETIQIQGEYQKTPVRITDDLISTALDWPDHYADVLSMGVRWKLYELNKDPRAGSMQMARGIPVYTGALGEFVNAIDEMARAEDFSNGEDLVYPDDNLGEGRDISWTGLFV